MENVRRYRANSSPMSLLGQVESIVDDRVLLNLVCDLQQKVNKIESVTGLSQRTRLFRQEIIRLEKRLSDFNPVWTSRPGLQNKSR